MCSSVKFYSSFDSNSLSYIITITQNKGRIKLNWKKKTISCKIYILSHVILVCLWISIKTQSVFHSHWQTVKFLCLYSHCLHIDSENSIKVLLSCSISVNFHSETVIINICSILTISRCILLHLGEYWATVSFSPTINSTHCFVSNKTHKKVRNWCCSTEVYEWYPSSRISKCVNLECDSIIY